MSIINLPTIQKQICCLTKAIQEIIDTGDTTYILTGAPNPDPLLGYDITLTGSDGSVNVVTIPISPDEDTTYVLSGVTATTGGTTVTLTGSDGSVNDVVVPDRDTTYVMFGGMLPDGDFVVGLDGSDGSSQSARFPASEYLRIDDVVDDGDFTAEADPAEPCAYLLTHTSSQGNVQTVGDIGRTNRIILDPGSSEHAAANNEPYISHQIAGSNPDANDGIAIPDAGLETRGTGADFSKVVDTSAGCIRQSALNHGRREAGVVVVDEKFYADTPRVERNDLPFQTVAGLTTEDRAATETVRFFSDTLITGNVLAWDTNPGPATLDFTGVEGLQGILDITGTGRVTVLGRPTVLSYRQQGASKAIVDLYDVVNNNAGTNAIRLVDGAEAKINAMDVMGTGTTGVIYVVNGAQLDLDARDIVRSGTSGAQSCIHTTGTGSPTLNIRARDFRAAMGVNVLDLGGASETTIDCRDVIGSGNGMQRILNATTNATVVLKCRDMMATTNTVAVLIISANNAQTTVKGRDFINLAGSGAGAVASASHASTLDFEFETAVANRVGISGFGSSNIRAKGKLLRIEGVGTTIDNAALLLANPNTYVEIDRIEYHGTGANPVIRIDGLAQLHIRNSHIRALSPDANAVFYRHTAPSSVSHLTFNGVIIRVAAPTIPVFNNAAGANALRVYSHGETFTNSTVLNGGSAVAITAGTIVLGAVIPPL